MWKVTLNKDQASVKTSQQYIIFISFCNQTERM